MLMVWLSYWGDFLSNQKNWRLEKIGNSGKKTCHFEILSVHDHCKHLATAGEITQQES